jgi:hypothetical protein
MTSIYGLGGIPGAAPVAMPTSAQGSTAGGINAATLAGGTQPPVPGMAPQMGMMLLNQILSSTRQPGAAGQQSLPYMMATGAI